MPIDFDLTAETKRLQRILRDWAVNDGRPFARQADRSHCLPTDTQALLASYPIDLNPLAGIPAAGKEYAVGMYDGSSVLGVTAIEQLAYGDMILIMLLRGSGIGGVVVKILGTPSQVDRWFGGFTRGEYSYGAFALTESHSGSDAAALTTTAARDGDHWILNGAKCFTTAGSFADYVVVFATIDKAAGTRGIRAFVVEKGTPGFKIIKANEEKLGVRALITTQFALDDVAVPADHLLGSADDQDGFRAALTTLSSTRPQAAAMAVGIAQASLDTCREYLQDERKAFAPRRWSRVKDELARMQAALDESRFLILNAAWRLDQGLPHAKEASMAKAYACPLAEQVCLRSLLLMGPDGYSEDFLVEKWYRDIKIFDIWEGTGNIQRLVITRHLFASQN